jgi:VanZ family protein
MDMTALDRLEPDTSTGTRHFAWLCVLYALLMLYSSTLVGPDGVNFVPLDPAEALHRFLATPFLDTGSDQRADWMGNLLMLVPFGFLVAGAIWPVRPMVKPPAAIGGLLTCAAVILAIKYLQLFFPPRTVSLNYIVAQSIGAAIGCAAFVLWRERISPSINRHDPVATLVLGLWLYSAALLVFLLMPLVSR